jgi:iron complex outermembrane receptor protein
MLKYKIFISIFLLTLQAQAQQSSLDSQRIKVLKEVAVAASLKTTQLSKLNLSEMDLPQAQFMLSSKQLAQQQVISLSDVLKNANGMYIMGTTGGYQEEIAARGAALASTNTFKNGIRYFNGMKMELSGLERVEILKGNAAIEYGNVAPGGVINLVTKKPKFENGGSVSLSNASFQNYTSALDFYGALDKKKKLAFRINSAYNKGASFRNNVHAESFYINPSLQINISPKSTLLLEADYTTNTSVPDFGAGIINYKLVDFPRERFTGVSWGKYAAKQTLTSAKYSTSVFNHWKLNATLAYRTYATDLFTNTRPNGSTSGGGTLVDAQGNWKRGIQKTTINDQYTLQQVDFTRTIKQDQLKHDILIGADAEQFTTTTLVYANYNNYDSINILQPYNAALEPAIPALNKSTQTSMGVQRAGIYMQDLISYRSKIKLLLGARWNTIQTNTNVLTYSTQSTSLSNTLDRPISPKLGIVYAINAAHMLFTSYSNSFSQNTGVDINGKALQASIIDQYELGIKNKMWDGNMQLNLTGYIIHNDNLAQTSLANGNTNSNIKELAGATRSAGVEVDLMYNPQKHIALMMGYSFNETIYTASNIYIVGSALRYNPNHTANASMHYEFSKGTFKNLSVGAIAQYMGLRYVGRSTRLTINNDRFQLIPIKEFMVVDLVASYKWQQWKCNAKLSNVFNQLSYHVHDDNSLNPIAPRNASLQLVYTF